MEYVISRKEVRARINRILDEMHRRGLDALYLASYASVAYVTNFFFIATERPLACILKSDGESILLVPRLELEHAEKYSYADRVLSYPEFPDEKHPMEYFKDFFEELKLADKTIGYDVDGYGRIYGYRGPRLSELLKNAKTVYAGDIIEEMRMVKSEEEIKLMRESAKWSIYAHRLLQEYTGPGLYEDEISYTASRDATIAMARALKGLYRPVGWMPGAHAGFRGQIGTHSYYPHSLSQHFIIKKNSILVTGASACISGYSVELERTLYVGEPDEEVRKYFDLMLKAREVAFNMLKPGVNCRDVDREVRKFYKENNLMEYWRHHTGHGLGLEMHEAPFLDIGYDCVLKPGMIVSIEPGIYVPNLGGFRHSDTVLITEDGYEILTKYPTSLDELIIEY